MSLVSVILNVFLWSIVALLFIALTPGLPPYDVEFEDIPAPEQIKFDGSLTPNDWLDRVELLSDKIDKSSIGYLKGIESFAVKDGYLYSGVQGGDIVRLPLSDPVNHSWQLVTKIGETCDSLSQESKCGRPLGMEFDSEGRLIVADAYYGLYRVNVDTGNKEVLVPATLLIDGKKNLVTNSLAISKDGKNIFYTTSSTRFSLSDGMYEILATPSGRVLNYDVTSNSSKVILDEVSFANGIVLSPNEDFILVCETGTMKVLKHHLKGDQIGQTEVFVVLPGAVDNIKSNGKGGYIVGVIVPSLPDKFYLLWHVRASGILCKLLVRICVLVQNLLGAIVQYVYPSPALTMLIHKIGNTEYMGANMLPSYALLVELDSQGKMTRSWHSAGGAIDKICEGFVFDGHLYLGSPYNLYVTRVAFE